MFLTFGKNCTFCEHQRMIAGYNTKVWYVPTSLCSVQTIIIIVRLLQKSALHNFSAYEITLICVPRTQKDIVRRDIKRLMNLKIVYNMKQSWLAFQDNT